MPLRVLCKLVLSEVHCPTAVDLAPVRLQSEVSPHMVISVAGRRKSSIATLKSASVRPLSRVYLKVLLHVILLVEYLRASRTTNRVSPAALVLNLIGTWTCSLAFCH